MDIVQVLGNFGIAFIVIGALLTISIVGAPYGIPLFIIGILLTSIGMWIDDE